VPLLKSTENVVVLQISLYQFGPKFNLQLEQVTLHSSWIVWLEQAPVMRVLGYVEM
jgi:hypothetical protein